MLRAVSLRTVFLCVCACVAAFAAAGVADPAAAKGKGRKGSGSYVIEFRSRPSEYFGHGYVVVGRETRSGSISASRKAGFMPDPKADDIETLGRVKGVVGFTAEDRQVASDESYRVRISRAAHDRVVARIDANKRRPHDFGLFAENCNTFAGRMARVAQLKTPDDDLVPPSDYVRSLRELNGRGARSRRARTE